MKVTREYHPIPLMIELSPGDLDHLGQRHDEIASLRRILDHYIEFGGPYAHWARGLRTAIDEALGLEAFRHK